MSTSIILLLLLGGVLIVPALGGGDDDEESSGNANGDEANEILGSSENDTINGTSGNDLIRTFLGDDEIYGNDGNDEIRAGGGADYVEGGAGLDFVRGGSGDDEIYGNDGNDRIISDSGNDFVDAGRGADIVRGGAGTDTILGGINADFDDEDRPIGNFGVADQLFGEDSDDLIIAWGGGSFLGGGSNDADEPSGLTNNDTLVTVTGEAIMENRDGNNTNIALANLQDDQVSTAIVLDFDIEDDTLVLTVDHSSTADMPDPYVPDFTVSFVAGTSETQGDGTFVEVTWDNPYGDPGDTVSESARAFLVGYEPSDIDGSQLTDDGGRLLFNEDGSPRLGPLLTPEIYLTEDASYTDPLATLSGLGLLPDTAIVPA